MNVTLLLALLLAPLLTSSTPLVGGHVTQGDARNPVVMPPQAINLRFSHALHLGSVGLECATCHDSATKSKRTKDYLIPSLETCLDCHDSEEIPSRWSADPRAKDNAISIPPARLHFAHARHVGLEGVTCASCHAGITETDLATVEHLPSMETCLGCHDGVKAPSDCATCHLLGRGGLIRTSFDDGRLRPDDHGVHWLKQHEAAAERDLASCASCHAQEDCLSCHDGAVPRSFHDGDYLARHPQDALANSPPCASCHELGQFCRDCHVRAQVTAYDRLYPSPAGNFHPAGWGDFAPIGPSHHSHVARKNLAGCTACHAQDDCTSCHVWFAGAPRTHPAGWRTSSVMQRLRRDNFATCLRCHNPVDPADPINLP